MYIRVCTLYYIHVYFMYILHQILGFIVRILHFVVNESTCHGGPCHKPFQRISTVTILFIVCSQCIYIQRFVL